MLKWHTARVKDYVLFLIFLSSKVAIFAWKSSVYANFLLITDTQNVARCSFHTEIIAQRRHYSWKAFFTTFSCSLFLAIFEPTFEEIKPEKSGWKRKNWRWKNGYGFLQSLENLTHFFRGLRNLHTYKDFLQLFKKKTLAGELFAFS